MGKQHICSLIRFFHKVGIGENVFLARFVYPDHSSAIRIVFGYFVDNVVAEVEIVGDVYLKSRKYAFIIKSSSYKLFVQIFHIHF